MLMSIPSLGREMFHSHRLILWFKCHFACLFTVFPIFVFLCLAVLRVAVVQLLEVTVYLLFSLEWFTHISYLSALYIVFKHVKSHSF